MFAKAAVTVLAIAGAACAVLALRHQRVCAAHQLACTHKRIAEHDRTLWRLRVEIAARTTPEAVHELVRRLGPMVAIGVQPPPDLALTAAPPLPPPQETPEPNQ